MTKISFTLLTVCLFVATIDIAWAVCPTCNAPGTYTCSLYSTYMTCLDTIASDATCIAEEKTNAAAIASTTRTAMALLGCSGVSGLASSLSLILAFSGLAYLLSNKR
ncbi:unnamed protein product [Lymnaea stagnalis]|uniref:Uncharacterized protein n=1 Tax=Lymnaea stagnalis TaxID=6523 RepID=A0AAV2HDZ5_LYMST